MTNLLDKNVITMLLKEADDHGWIEVGVDGIKANKTGDIVGSLRASTFSPSLRTVYGRAYSHYYQVSNSQATISE